MMRFKQSNMVNISETKPFNEEFSFTQWVADNVDHNIATLDRKGSFHGIGITACSIKTNTLEMRNKC